MLPEKERGFRMTEIEVPLEQAQEEVQHAALHGSGGEHQSMINKAALLSAFLAVFAAISALFAGHYANEAMISQIQSSDKWSYYQAKGIKLAIAELKNDTNPTAETKEKIEGYKSDQEEISHEAEQKEDEARENLHRHESLAASVTIFQVAIALTAISVLTRKKSFLITAAVLGSLSVLWMIKSFLFL